MRTHILLLVLPLFALASVSCSKEATVNSKMEEIAGEYSLRAVINYSYNDLSAYGYDMINRPIGTIEKKGDNWYFNYLLPCPAGGSINFVKVEQPMTWEPILDAYCFIGTKLAGPDLSSAGTPVMFYDTAKKKVAYIVYDAADAPKYQYVWTKNE